jgi:hypothetical protein
MSRDTALYQVEEAVIATRRAYLMMIGVEHDFAADHEDLFLQVLVMRAAAENPRVTTAEHILDQYIAHLRGE